MTTSVDRPVTSSICLATVTPSSTFSNFTVPAYSVMIGRVCGSHVGELRACLDGSTVIDQQRGTVGHLVALALAAHVVGHHDSAEREITIFSPLALAT
jgi:hypothetical protein